MFSSRQSELLLKQKIIVCPTYEILKTDFVYLTFAKMNIVWPNFPMSLSVSVRALGREDCPAVLTRVSAGLHFWGGCLGKQSCYKPTLAWKRLRSHLAGIIPVFSHWYCSTGKEDDTWLGKPCFEFCFKIQTHNNGHMQFLFLLD